MDPKQSSFTLTESEGGLSVHLLCGKIRQEHEIKDYYCENRVGFLVVSEDLKVHCFTCIPDSHVLGTFAVFVRGKKLLFWHHLQRVLGLESVLPSPRKFSGHTPQFKNFC